MEAKCRLNEWKAARKSFFINALRNYEKITMDGWLSRWCETTCNVRHRSLSVNHRLNPSKEKDCAFDFEKEKFFVLHVVQLSISYVCKTHEKW